ncbi:hypothetical protein EYF80_008531 [Liparis tanakae]|uniref:Secreted protein n=1 Tax=Liparis tanakae TaxID=230148 RepID=A0A4Z2ITX5_9TELE|nr:hypothetical protein EYF80_008531 [Liparis tanakae]
MVRRAAILWVHVCVRVCVRCALDLRGVATARGDSRLRYRPTSPPEGTAGWWEEEETTHISIEVQQTGKKLWRRQYGKTGRDDVSEEREQTTVLENSGLVIIQLCPLKRLLASCDGAT